MKIKYMTIFTLLVAIFIVATFVVCGHEVSVGLFETDDNRVTSFETEIILGDWDTIEHDSSTESDEITSSNAPKVFTYKEYKQSLWATNVVNVRKGPDVEFEILGGLNVNQKVNVTGQCNETSWYRIEYNGGIGYVSNKYLSINSLGNSVETEATTENVTEKSMEKPTEKLTEKPTEKPTEKLTEGSTEKPTERPTEELTKKPEEEKSTKKPEEEKSTKKPEEEKSTKKPEEEKTTKKPEEEKPTKKTEEEKLTKKPEEEKLTKKQEPEKPTKKPEEKPTKKPTPEKPTPKKM